MEKTSGLWSKKIRTWLARTRRKIVSHVWLARGLLIVGVVGAVTLVLVLLGMLLSLKAVELAKVFVFKQHSGIAVIDQRTNILLLGKSGEGYLAPDLTDTIIFVSVSHAKPYTVTLVSIPRDIWVDDLRAKLNSAYYWGNRKKEGGGLVLAKSSVEDIVGLPVNYAVVVDFSAFEDVIDTIGGIEVDVTTAFRDTKYPIAGREADLCGGDMEYNCRYETIKFGEGLQKMDGATALKFVRSRNAEGDEGTDLARAARQQQVIAAIKDKLLTPQVFLSPRRLLALWGIARNSVETDLPDTALAYLARLALMSPMVASHVLDGELLENPPISHVYDNQYVFIPQSGNWREVQTWVKNLLP